MEIYILFALLVAGLCLEFKYKEHLFKTRKQRLLVYIIIFFSMMTWEFVSKFNNIWSYPGSGMVGWYPFGLPIELYIFYFVLPYFAFTFYEFVHIKFDNK